MTNFIHLLRLTEIEIKLNLNLVVTEKRLQALPLLLSDFKILAK